MSPIELNIKALILALLFGAILAAALFFLKKISRPHVKFSDVKRADAIQKNFKEQIAGLPLLLKYMALLFFVLAFIDFHSFSEKENADNDSKNMNIPTEGIAIYLLLDNSGSMNTKLNIFTDEGTRESIRKVDLLKRVTNDFVSGNKSSELPGRPNDLIGLISFARTAQILSPLTLDHKLISKKLAAFDVNRDPTQLGTAVGYAIFKAVNLIRATNHYGQELVKEGKPAYEIKNSIILLVTDGFQEVNPDDESHPLRSIDMEQAAQFAKENGVKLYIVNIEPAFADDQFIEYRQLFQKVTEETGGKFFMVDQPQDLKSVYSEIDQIEKSRLPEFAVLDKESFPHLFKRISFYPYLIAMGMAALFLSIILKTTFLRRVL